ncbi:L-asparagine permease, partial [Mycobacterium tuberculosis]
TGLVAPRPPRPSCPSWRAFPPLPPWPLALLALLVVLSLPLLSVRLFGALAFWASLLPVLALVPFLLVGPVFLAGRS